MRLPIGDEDLYARTVSTAPFQAHAPSIGRFNNQQMEGAP
jgi:hypothetical protein